MPENTLTLADVCHEVRSKNAGPFWVTIDIFVKDGEMFEVVADESFLNERTVADLYRVDLATIRMFRLPDLNVVKISFPRPVPQGSLHDRDIHAGQHHVPLAVLPVPHGR
ncbi:DUF4387 domain-containing protein [Myceligenerans pegani]|uniref:DUF4387 domain-containing protein n=1 Tax=Myceligenerans pegani TaxID=2776917 RepID=A0ABR9MYQ6_9MICO|nr:DUF4387 domain-containing protein [Myceligenerans sp. TRM 65318]MBE1876069.1 DUF4387 domain-containing protein [Myceligenerans sp. TRM 65318]MBE3018340.1 DUF4387 domain-containing protein [Myceligenerans sp. TRM 65318]